MSILTDLFGGGSTQDYLGNYYQGSDWLSGAGAGATYKPSTYSAFNPQSFGQGMGTNYENATNQQLSGQLAPSQLAALNQQFGQNLASVREGGSGMPSGAEKGLEYQAANQNYMNAANLGQQNIAQGQNAAMSYLNLGQQNQQFGQSLLNNQSQFGANYDLNKAQYAGNLNQSAYNSAANQANSNQGIFGGLVNTAGSWLGNQIFGQQQNQGSPYSAASQYSSQLQQNPYFQPYGM